MKKILILCISLVVICTCLVSCNEAIFDPGAFSFTHVHITDYVEGHCLEVAKWWNNESGLEIRITDGGSIFLSEGTYQLFSSKAACPYCK